MSILVILLAWVLFAYVFAAVLPVVFVTIGNALCFLALCLWQVARLAGIAIAWSGTRGGRMLWLASTQAAQFTFILIDEWLRGPPPPEEEAEEDDTGEPDDDEPESPQSAYEDALALLGLCEPFTRADLTQVYRRAMKSAHTDVGGTNEKAVALNLARELILKVKGW